ncbi:MAG: alanine racemase [Bacilli bacterium]
MKVNYDHIVDNIIYLQNKYDKKIFVVAKNNAYNTGIIKLVPILIKAKITHFAINTLNEGIAIRKQTSKAYILVMNPLNPDEIKRAREYNLVLGITSYKWYLLNHEYLQDMKLHLKINVGMNRFGLNNIEQINEIINNNSNIEGLYTHFSVSDEPNLDKHYQQRDFFLEIYHSIKKINQLKYIHTENSATLLLNDPQLAFLNYARLGILCYGYSPTTFDPHLKASMYCKRSIIDIHYLQKDECIGYGFNNTYYQDTLVAVVAFGYGNGLSKLRSLLPVVINNNRYDILSISMSHLIIAIDDNVNIGDMVEIYGDHIKIDHLLEKCETTCSIHMASLHQDSIENT